MHRKFKMPQKEDMVREPKSTLDITNYNCQLQFVKRFLITLYHSEISMLWYMAFYSYVIEFLPRIGLKAMNHTWDNRPSV